MEFGLPWDPGTHQKDPVLNQVVRYFSSGYLDVFSNVSPIVSSSTVDHHPSSTISHWIINDPIEYPHIFPHWSSIIIIIIIIDPSLIHHWSYLIHHWSFNGLLLAGLPWFSTRFSRRQTIESPHISGHSNPKSLVPSWSRLFDFLGCAQVPSLGEIYL